MLCLSSLVLVVDSMALTVAVPQMTRDLGASAQDTQWILDSYILVFAGLLLTSGSLGDRFGRRKVMIIGLVLFGTASLAATLAADPAQMIAVRIAMGIGGALIMPSTLSIMITVFDDAERPKAMAAWTSVAMVGLVGSPVLGGVLIAHFSWHAIFFINIPVVALAIVAGLVLMPESRGPWRKPDPFGAVLSAAGMTALVWWIIEMPPHGAFGGRPAITLAIAVVALGGFVIWEHVTPEPMVPLNLFRHRNFTGGSLSLALLQTGNGGLLLVHPVPAVRARLLTGQGGTGVRAAGRGRDHRQRGGRPAHGQDRTPDPRAERDAGDGRLVRATDYGLGRTGP